MALHHMERYRSGHNGADSKDSIPKVRTSANFSDCTRDPPGSNFHKFISFLRVVLLFSKTGYTLRYTEGYRSGHNGADSKSCGAFGFPSSEILDIWCFLDYAVSSRLDSIYAFSTLCAE